jgi:hypothetical protein
MRIAVPAEIKNNEYRVAITPAGVKDLVSAGHSVVIQSGAGLGSNVGALFVCPPSGHHGRFVARLPPARGVFYS